MRQSWPSSENVCSDKDIRPGIASSFEGSKLRDLLLLCSTMVCGRDCPCIGTFYEVEAGDILASKVLRTSQRQDHPDIRQPRVPYVLCKLSKAGSVGFLLEVL